MATWYVRPATTHNVTRDGTTYATAWGGWSEVVWGVSGVTAGDTLAMCGPHTSATNLQMGAHLGTAALPMVLRGDDVNEAGTMTFTGGSGFFDLTRNYTQVRNLTIYGTTTRACIAQAAAAGTVIDGCTLIGGNIGVSLGSGTAFTSCQITNNHIYGQAGTVGYGISHTVTGGSLTPQGVYIANNNIHDCVQGIHNEVGAAVFATTRFHNIKIQRNIVFNTTQSSIYFRSCVNDQTNQAALWSTDCIFSQNQIRDCGTIAGANGQHGGITVMGCSSPLIYMNEVKDVYVTGAGIQTAKNQAPQIYFNRVSHIRSGTPSGSFQNGKPIDGNGIFMDIFTVGGLCFGNRIDDCITTGNVGSGSGVAFWRASNARIIGNIITNCAVGFSYGHPNETGNLVYHNTFVNCTVGIAKINANALDGNVTVTNNLLFYCDLGFVITANPSITNNFNNVFGSTTAYTGVSAGVNDLAIDPDMDKAFRVQNVTLQTAGTTLGGIDFYGKEFSPSPCIGAVGRFIPRSVNI